jgi:hypothetical protein
LKRGRVVAFRFGRGHPDAFRRLSTEFDVLPLPFDDGSAFDRRPGRAVEPDVELTFRVIQRIFDDPRLAGQRVTVQAQNGVVTLLGTVSGLYARVTAADLARETPGVSDICNRLELARTADVTAAVARPDAFDEIVAGWDEIGPGTPRRPVRAWLLRAGAVASFLFRAPRRPDTAPPGQGGPIRD